MKKEKKDKHFIKKPYYEGGISAMRAFIRQHLQYPKAALQAKIEGTVHIRYTINHKGKVVATKIIAGIGHGCDEEAVRLVELLEFIAPKNRNIKAIFHKTIQIHFRLPEQEKSTIQYNYTTTKTPKKPKPKSKGKSYIITIRT